MLLAATGGAQAVPTVTATPLVVSRGFVRRLSVGVLVKSNFRSLVATNIDPKSRRVAKGGAAWTCCTSFFKFMNYNKKTWLTPVDPYYTIEIDFSGDIDEIKEQIEELKNQYKKRANPDKEVDPLKEADIDTSK